jgi:hypothetical protein
LPSRAFGALVVCTFSPDSKHLAFADSDLFLQDIATTIKAEYLGECPFNSIPYSPRYSALMIVAVS